MNRWIRWIAVGWIGMWLIGGGAAAVAQEQADQKKPTAQEVQEAQAAMEQMMGPMMGQMMSAMMEGMAKTLARKEIAEDFATFARNYYLALVNRGFSEEEAMRIVTTTGIPSAGTGKQ